MGVGMAESRQHPVSPMNTSYRIPCQEERAAVLGAHEDRGQLVFYVPVRPTMKGLVVGDAQCATLQRMMSADSTCRDAE